MALTRSLGLMRLSFFILTIVQCQAEDESMKSSYLDGPRAPLSPVEYRTSPLIVELNFIVEGFGDVRPMDMDFDIDLSINMTWKLERPLCQKYERSLHYDGLNIVSGASVVIPPVRLSKSTYWLPDLFLVDAKRATMSSELSITTNGKFRSVQNCSMGQMIIMSKQLVVVSCQLDFSRFPFDEHRCPLKIRSFSHQSDIVQIVKSSTVPALTLGNNCLQEYAFSANVTEIKQDRIWFESDKVFSCLVIEMTFRRKILSIILTALLPSYVIVLVSMLAYLMDVNCTYERIILTITALVTQYTQMTVVRAGLPHISKVTHCDVYMNTCLFFNLAIVVECALIDKINSDEKESMLDRSTKGVDGVATLADGSGQRRSQRSQFEHPDPASDDGRILTDSPLENRAPPLDDQAAESWQQFSPEPYVRHRLPTTAKNKRGNRSGNRVTNQKSKTSQLITPWSSSMRREPRPELTKDSSLKYHAKAMNFEFSTQSGVCENQLYLTLVGPRAARIDKVFTILMVVCVVGFQAGWCILHLDFFMSVELFNTAHPLEQ